MPHVSLLPFRKKKTDDATTGYSEQEVRDICSVLFESVKYIHSQGIVHRDLKPENILLASENDIKSIKLADFGFACRMGEHLADDPCGTPLYMAPEIINNKQHGMVRARQRDEGGDGCLDDIIWK